MKNKRFLIFAACLLFFFLRGANETLFAAQTDFYGTWESKFSDEGVIFTVRFTISESTLIMELGFDMGKQGQQFDSFEMEIVEWTAINNSNNRTVSNYPNGFSLRLSMDGDTESIDLFLSRDGTEFIFTQFQFPGDEIIAFRRQRH